VTRHSWQYTLKSPIRFSTAIALAGALLATAPATPCYAARTIDVAFIMDHQLQLVEVDAMVRKELETLLGEDFTVRYPESARVVTGADPVVAREAADSLLSDPEIDIVIGLGASSAVELGSRGPLAKPAFAALVFDSKLLGLPSDEGTSGVTNFNYVTSPVDFARLAEFVREVTTADKIALLIDGRHLSAYPAIADRIKTLAGSLNVQVELVSVGDSLAGLADKIPADVDAVIATPLLRFTAEQVSGLATDLVARRLPSFAFLGTQEVELGFLASNSPDSEFMRIARRLSLNVQRTLLGDDAAEFPLALSADAAVTINAKTAVDIGKVPAYDLLISAKIINEEALKDTKAMTLAEAMHSSVQVNLDLQAEERVVAAGRSDVMLSIAKLLPQARASFLATVIDADRAAQTNGRTPEKDQRARAEVSQVIFDEKLMADVSIRKHLLASTEASRDQVRLDVIQGTGIAFLQVLRAEATRRIRKENERVTKENLKLAETRRKVGTAAAGEVYRWRSQLARDQRSAIFAFRDRRQAEIALNRILDRDTESRITLDPAAPPAAMHLFGDEQVQQALSKPAGFGMIRTMLVAEAMVHSPELREIQEQITAQQRVLASARRSFWMPTFSLNGRFDRVVDEGGDGSGLRLDDDDQWTVGFEAGIPLFEGGRRVFAQRQAYDTLSELRLRESAARKRVDGAVRTAAFQAWSSLMAIDLSRSASESAARNLELVTGSYSRGAVSVVELLDAQNAATTSADEAENAVFDYLVDLLSLQREIGRFWLFLSEDERAAELNRAHVQLAGQEAR